VLQSGRDAARAPPAPQRTTTPAFSSPQPPRTCHPRRGVTPRGIRRANSSRTPLSTRVIRGFRLAEKVSGCWRNLATLRRHCHIRPYLESARSHGRRPLDAIRDTFAGIPWMPPRTGVALLE